MGPMGKITRAQLILISLFTTMFYLQHTLNRHYIVSKHSYNLSNQSKGFTYVLLALEAPFGLPL